MGRIPSRFLMVSVGVALALAGCSSGGGSSSERPDVPRSAPQTTTTAAPARIDLSQPIPGGSLHGTPRPPLENTGDDYVAVLRSIVANFRWLTENPDTAVVSELYVPGTPDHDGHTATFNDLVGNEWRAADDGYHVGTVEIIDNRPEAVSLHVTDAMSFERIVDANGAQVGEGRPRSPEIKSWAVLIVPDAAGRWRIADWAPADGAAVEL